MHYPLTIEQFQYPIFEDDMGREFITAYINAVNNFYEEGKKKKNSGIRFTSDMVKEWYERTYNTKCEFEEDMMFFDIYTEDANRAWQQGVRADRKSVV